ncbi:MAG: hypothetical protein NT027_15970 [Proteobacteria bacterium]|nr:hypothetical protein [Pseudomonadota bacterium]
MLRRISLLLAAFSLATSSFAAGAKWKKGDKVDVEQGGKFYKAKIVEPKDGCFTVLYDDGTVSSQGKDTMAALGTHTEGEKSPALKGEVGEAIDLQYNGGGWYRGKITGKSACFLVSYIGWPETDNEVVGEGRIFKWDSKVKGDTSKGAAAASGGGSGGGSTGEKKYTPEQIAHCATMLKDRNACMRSAYCAWADDKCGTRQW